MPVVVVCLSLNTITALLCFALNDLSFHMEWSLLWLGDERTPWEAPHVCFNVQDPCNLLQLKLTKKEWLPMVINVTTKRWTLDIDSSSPVRSNRVVRERHTDRGSGIGRSSTKCTHTGMGFRLLICNWNVNCNQKHRHPCH